MSQLSITVDTEDSRVVREVSEMLLRLSGQAELPLVAVPNYAEMQVATSQESMGSQYIGQEPVEEDDIESPNGEIPQVDSAGTPWDARIHSSSKGTVANGTWKKRKNLPEGVYESVMAEIMGNAPTSAMPNNEPTATQPVEHITDGATPPPPPPPPPPPAQESGYMAPATFAELLQRMTAAKIPVAKLQEWCTKEGIGSFTLLGQHPDHIAPAALFVGV